jgi:hypothetical protein
VFDTVERTTRTDSRDLMSEDVMSFSMKQSEGGRNLQRRYSSR